MNAVDSRFRKNFIVASILHVALIGGIIGWESFFSDAGKPALASVELITPADILGDLPKGEGHGRGAYAPPKEPAGANEPAGPNEAMSPPDETPAPSRTPRTSAGPKSDPNEIAIPKESARKKETVEDRRKAESGKTATVATNKSASKKALTKATSTSAVAKSNGLGGEEAIRNRLARALQAEEGGTPYGDNKAPGGGSGKSNRIGSPDGSPDGEANGVGQGSPYWQYYEHVHDKMYEAWDQSGEGFQKGLVSSVMIRVARDGSITNVELLRSSGSKTMDESAVTAARKVRLLDPPPDGLVRGTTADIRIDFQVEG